MSLHRSLVFVLPALALSAPAPGQSWLATNVPGFGSAASDGLGSLEVDGFLYTATQNPGAGVGVWRYDGVAPWVQVNADGFGDANNAALASAAVVGGDLFAMTENCVSGTEVWRFDGATWTQTNPDGFGDPSNARGELFVLEGTLYASASNSSAGCGVARYDGPAVGWTVLGFAGLGSTANVDADLQVLAGDLYAATENGVTGCEVLRHVSGTTWTRVDPGSGFDASGSANGDAGLYVFGGKLYASTENFATGLEVWEYLGGSSWTQIGSDGLGDPSNVDFEGVAPFASELYVGTIAAGGTGAEVWRFDGATSFSQVGAAGFGSASNAVVLSLVEHEGALHASTINPTTGAEVWRLDGASSWVRIDPGDPSSSGGFGDPTDSYAQLTVLRGELHATLSTVVWRLRPQEIGISLCAPGVANSTGLPAEIRATGRAVAAANDVVLTATRLPFGGFGFFVNSFDSGPATTPAGSVGDLCLAGAVGKHDAPGEVQRIGTSGAFSIALDLTAFPRPSGAVAAVAGDTLHFQAWYRDRTSLAPTSNFSEGVTIELR